MTGTSELSDLAPQTGAAGGATQQQLLVALAVPDLDVAGARAAVETAALQRRRGRRVLGASAAAVVLIAGVVALVALGGSDPDDIVADRDDRDDTSTTTSSSTVAPELVTEPTLVTTTSEVVASTTQPTVPSTTVPPDTVPQTLPAPPTTLPNQPLRAELVITTPTVQAGDTATARVVWSDADHAGNGPIFAANWGDPAVAGAPANADPGQPCDIAGPPANASQDLTFRYATPGTHRLTVVVTTCGARGAFGERVEVAGDVTVTAPTVSGGSGRAIVAFQARGGQSTLPSLDEAAAVFTPELTPEAPLALQARVPALQLFAASGPATVLRLPAQAKGTIRLTWPGTSCVATAGVDLAAAAPAQAPVVQLIPGPC